MRDKHLESHQTNRLRHILDSFAKSSNEVRFPFVKILHFDHYYIFQSILDLAMIAGDVHVVHFLCSMTVRKLRDSVTYTVLLYFHTFITIDFRLLSS